VGQKLLLGSPEILKKGGSRDLPGGCVGKDAFGQREMAGREKGSFGWRGPGREKEGTQ